MNENQNEFNAYESSKKRKKYFIGAILLVVFIGIGYAFLQTTLNISGTTKVSKNTWEIYWNNIQVKNGSVTGTQVTTIPTLSVNNTKVTFEVNLKQPGEYYEFTVDAVNNGTLDAMIDDIDFDVDNGGTLPAYLDYSVTYEDDVPLVEKQILKAKETNENVETYKVRVEFKKNITSTDLPDDENGETVVCTLDVSYVQADSTSIPVREVVYTISETVIEIGQPIPAGVETFDDPEDAMGDTHSVFLRHVLTDDKVVLSYVGAKYRGYVYYAMIGRDAYPSNKLLIGNTYQSDECEEGEVNAHPEYSFLGNSPNHYYTHCKGKGADWEALIDSEEMIYYTSYDGYGCVVLENRSLCGTREQLNSFELGQ